MYLSSADFMTRITERRVEVAAPILDNSLADRVCGMFTTMLSDNVKARELCSDGQYRRVSNVGKAPLNSQSFFYEEAYKAAEQSAPDVPEKPAEKTPQTVPSKAPDVPDVPKPGSESSDAPIKVRVRKLRKQ